MADIAFIRGSKKFDGITISSNNIVDALTDLGHTVSVYQCSDSKSADKYDSRGLLIKGIGLGSSVPVMGFNRLVTFPRRLRDIRVKNIFVSDPSMAFVSREPDITTAIVYDLRPLTEFADRKSTTAMFRLSLKRLRNMRNIIVPTEYIRRMCVEFGVEDSQIYTVPESSTFPPDPGHVERSVERINTRNEIHLVCVATDRPYKDVVKFIRLSRQMEHYDSPRFRFTLLSDITLKTATEIKRNGLPGNLSIIRKAGDMKSIYSEADALVFTSRYEGFGRPLVEAMSFGLPIIANSIPVTDEILGNSGILVNNGESDRWVDALLRIANVKEYRKYSRLSIERSSIFSYERLVDSVARIPLN